MAAPVVLMLLLLRPHILEAAEYVQSLAGAVEEDKQAGEEASKGQRRRRGWQGRHSSGAGQRRQRRKEFAQPEGAAAGPVRQERGQRRRGRAGGALLTLG
jgi:hypothetical protein